MCVCVHVLMICTFIDVGVDAGMFVADAHSYHMPEGEIREASYS